MAATQLYPTSRLAGMSDDALEAVLRMALADQAETNLTCVYDGMDRHDTVLTAQQTQKDVAAEQRRRELAAWQL